MAMTMAEAIDVGIQETLTPRATSVELVRVYDELPSSVSKEEYAEFVKRNLALNTKQILEYLEDDLR